MQRRIETLPRLTRTVFCLFLVLLCCEFLKVEDSVISGSKIEIENIPVIVNDVNINEMMFGLRNSLKVGDVVQTVLSEEKFIELHGLDWLLMDGRELNTSTKLANLTSWTNVPNVQDKYFFISQTADSTVDTFSESIAQPVAYNGFGSVYYQHRHSLSGSLTDNAGTVHSHTYDRLWGNGGPTSVGWPGGSCTQNEANPTSMESTDGAHTHANTGKEFVSHYFNHGHTISGWDSVTRPNSFVLRSFILVN